MASKLPTHITPRGIAKFPQLTEPSTRFRAEGEYSVKLLLTHEQAAPLMAVIEEAHEAAVEEARDEAVKKLLEKTPKASAAVLQKTREGIKIGSMPWKEDTDRETGEPTGYLSFQFKLRASGVTKEGKSYTRKPLLADGQGKEIKNVSGLSIWSGSELRVAFYCKSYYTDMAGAGVSLKLKGAQILKLVSGGDTAESLGFGADEDSEYEYDPSEFGDESSEGFTPADGAPTGTPDY